MDIVKQLRYVFFFLGLLLLALPVLDYFGISPEELYDRLTSGTKAAVATAQGYAENEEVHKIFEIQAEEVPHTQKPAALKTMDLSAQDEKNAEIAKTEEVKALGDVVEGLEKSARPSGSSTKSKSKWIAPPIGFNTKMSYSFLIYRELKPITEQIEKLLQGIHGNLMMDLVPFTTVRTPDKSLVVLFTDQQNFMDFTKRPSWSGAACDVPRETLYVLESEGMYPLSIHEMTHLYFDGFFSPKRMPLWISEGMATYMQIRASGQTPTWADNALNRIKAGQVIDMGTFTETKTLGDMPSDYVELWYTQAYSIVDYLLNKRTRDEFYTFCINMSNGEEQTTAMYHAYGLPFTKFETLRNIWLHDSFGVSLTDDSQAAVNSARPRN